MKKIMLLILVLGLLSQPACTGESQGTSYRDSLLDLEHLLTVNKENIRIILYRSYLPQFGRDQVPLPDVTLVENGAPRKLPLCPNRNTSSDADFGPVRELFAKSADNLPEILREIARIARVVRKGEFPYCAWWSVTDVDNFNIAFPDAAATYWAMPFIADDDTQVLIDGVYPHERYMSLALYDQKLDPYYDPGPSAQDAIPSFLADYQIDPKLAGENPWQDATGVVGAAYRVTIKADPTSGESNALPWFGESKSSALGADGSFPLPAPCNTPGSPYTCTTEGMFMSPPSAAQSSVFSNPDNRYLPATISVTVPIFSFQNPDRVFVIRGKLPRTPSGREPVPWSDDTTEYDMRYWSMCNAIYARPYPTIGSILNDGRILPNLKNSGCVADLDIVINNEEDRFYNIVVSTREGRPSNANRANGVNWIEAVWGVRNLLIVRNMLPSSHFPYATQNIPMDGSWVSAVNTMEDYYPAITAECTKAHYEAFGWQGCVAPKGGGDPHLSGSSLPGAYNP